MLSFEYTCAGGGERMLTSGCCKLQSCLFWVGGEEKRVLRLSMLRDEHFLQGLADHKVAPGALSDLIHRGVLRHFDQGEPFLRVDIKYTLFVFVGEERERLGCVHIRSRGAH